MIFPFFYWPARLASSLLFLAAFCSAAAQTPAAREQWPVFRSHDANDCLFSVRLPKKPSIAKDQLKPSSADIFWIWTYSAVGARAGYTLSCTISPPYLSSRGRESTMLAQQRDEMIRKTGGKLLEDKPITVDGVPGRAFTIRFIANNLTFLSFNEFILTEHTLYQLSVTIPTEYIALNRAQDVDRFFNSFKLSPE